MIPPGRITKTKLREPSTPTNSLHNLEPHMRNMNSLTRDYPLKPVKITQLHSNPQIHPYSSRENSMDSEIPTLHWRKPLPRHTSNPPYITSSLPNHISLTPVYHPRHDIRVFLSWYLVSSQLYSPHRSQSKSQNFSQNQNNLDKPSITLHQEEE